MSFFGLGPTELAIILVIVAVIFGVGRLPEIGGAMGRSIREFKRSSSEEETPASATPAAAAASSESTPLPKGPETREGAVRREEV